MNIIKALKKTIKEIVDERLAITEHELNGLLVTSENFEEINDIKAACYSLEQEQQIGIMTAVDGEMVLVSIQDNTTLH